MKDLKKKHLELLGKSAVAALTKKHFLAQYVSDKKEALEEILKLIKPGDTIGLPGSNTIVAIGLEKILKEKGHEIYNHQGLPKEEKRKIQRKELTSDVFIASSNAITLDGKIINVDGAGNRVAGMIFGPNKVVIVVGANKVVKNEEEGRERIRLVAAPTNVARFGLNNPCNVTGYCMDCDSPTRICCVTTVFERPMASGADMHIIVVGEELGF
jgi:hypothetical protein